MTIRIKSLCSTLFSEQENTMFMGEYNLRKAVSVKNNLPEQKELLE